MAGVRVPIVPMAHEYLVSQPFDAMREARAARGHLPTMRDPDLLVYYREDGDGIVMGGYERDCAPWSLDDAARRPHPAGLQRPAARGGVGPLRGDHRELAPPRPGDGPADRDAADQRARGVHARQRVLPRRDGGPRPLRRRRVLRARAGGRGRRRQGDGRVDPQRRAADGRLADGRAPLRARSTARRATRSRARRRSTRPTTTSSTRATSGRPVGRCASRAPTAGTRSTARRSARSPAGSASTGTSRTPRPATSRCARDGWAGRHWSPAIGAEHRAHARARRPLRRVLVRQARDLGRRARRSSSSGCATTTSHADVGAVTYTQMLNARGGIECDFTVARLGEERFQIVTGTAFGQHDAAWLRRHAPRDGSVEIARHDLALGVLRAVGAARARHPRAAHAGLARRTRTSRT